MVSDFHNFIYDYAHNFNRNTTLDLLSSYGRIDDLLRYCEVIEDWERVIEHWIQNNAYEEALEVPSYFILWAVVFYVHPYISHVDYLSWKLSINCIFVAFYVCVDIPSFSQPKILPKEFVCRIFVVALSCYTRSYIYMRPTERNHTECQSVHFLGVLNTRRVTHHAHIHMMLHLVHLLLSQNHASYSIWCDFVGSKGAKGPRSHRRYLLQILSDINALHPCRYGGYAHNSAFTCECSCKLLKYDDPVAPLKRNRELY